MPRVRDFENAIGRMGTPNKYDFRKNPEEGLTEHLMIGFFNEWIDIEDELLKKFFEKATAKLRGKAARFLTTGFKLLFKKDGLKYGFIKSTNFSLMNIVL